MFFRFLSYNAIIVFFKLISSFVVSKVSAIFLGPSGYALVGNFRNVFQMAVSVTASGFESGAIRYIAEKKEDNQYQVKVISSLLVLSLFLSVIVGIVLLVLSKMLSVWILKTQTFAYVFKLLGILLPLISSNFLILYITNGFQKLKVYTKLMILYSITYAVTTFIAIYYFNLKGALIAIVLVSALTLAFSVLIEDVRVIFSKVVLDTKHVSIQIIKSLSVYLLMATYSIILISVTSLMVRNTIISEINETHAGYWEAMTKISMFYMVFFTSIFTLYLLPNLSKNQSLEGYKNIMRSFLKQLVPVMLGLFVVLFLCRILAIRLFLTEEFLAIESFFSLQIIGDFLKVIGFALAYQFHAKRMVTYYFITDAIIYLSFYFLSVYFLEKVGLEGVFYAHIISCGLYLVAVSFFIFTKNKYYLIADEK